MGAADDDDATPRQGGAPRPGQPPRNALLPPLTPAESAAHEKAARVNKVEARIRRDYQILVEEIGEKEAALKLFAIPEKRKCKPKGSTRLWLDTEMLAMYDGIFVSPYCPPNIRGLPYAIAKHFHKLYGTKAGASAKSIEARLRRLLKQRDTEGAAEALKRKDEWANRPNFLSFARNDK